MNDLTARFQVIGVNDSADFCECCGRQGLKRVVWVLDRETGDHKHFGTTCVLAPTKCFHLDREAKAAIREFARAQAAARKSEWLNRVKYGKAA
jgi:predicted metal-binding protein